MEKFKKEISLVIGLGDGHVCDSVTENVSVCVCVLRCHTGDLRNALSLGVHL